MVTCYDRGLFTSSHLYAPPQHVVPSHAAGVASEGILPPLGGRSMHYSANELRRIPLPRTWVNSASPRSRRAQQTRGLNTSGAYLSGGEADELGESLRWWPGDMPHSCKPARHQHGERTEG